MAPLPQPVNPIELKRAYQELSRMQQEPLSQRDGVSITITIKPDQPSPSNQYVEQRSADILSQILFNSQY